MKKHLFVYAALIALAAAILRAQEPIAGGTITRSGEKPALAVPDFRGSGEAQNFMAAFNSTLNADLQASGLFDIKPKTLYPKGAPQQASDLRPEDAGAGFALQDWAGAPVNASHLVFGYTAAVNGVLALYGNVYDTRQKDPQGAKLFAQTYAEAPTEAGAINLGHKFAADIIQKFGGSGSLLGSRIYFTSSRGAVSGGTELWVMDFDGQNQKQLTSRKGLIAYPTVSPDGSRLAYTYWPLNAADPRPRIEMVNSQTGRTIAFYNQAASLNAAATFTPDGSKIFYSSSASGAAQIYSAGSDGRDFTRITDTKGNPTEPKVNPKNPNSLLFVQGFQNEQIYKMNSEGAGIERVTNGEGEASNPAWSPDGQKIAFSWTRGYATGAFNIFVMAAGSPLQYNQLTSNAGKNENPVWAPDGIHIVFMSTRAGKTPQIFSMLADGTQVKQLTTSGTNKYPVWGVK